ncbi:potassium ion transporter [Niveomyces insectorum RCEF 264]|uniref:Potassium transport protein n=1 Tax=Niveomyces insectorum RCEF 264 TaxID=1081102 RepID=A0A162KC85_9HYPO|nr:potassium ion transporter [Niveomyces insectorum RCEF 264]
MESIKDILWSQIKALQPSLLTKKPHFNFITFHYFFVLVLTFVGSVLIFGPGKGNLRYIDSLFFAAGGATQAGLNTVDVNLITTYQQCVVFVIAGVANPMAINSFVVMLRLYWFEKRFQHIVQEARLRRATLSKSKSKHTGDPSRLEHGVNGRHITVIHNGAPARVANDGSYLGPLTKAATDGATDGAANKAANGAANGDARGQVNGTAIGAAVRTANGAANGVTLPSSDENGAATGRDGPAADRNITPAEVFDSRRQEITFAPTVKRSDGLGEDVVKLPPRLTDEEHIAILQRQRNQTDDDVLRIPGPRDVERGILPSRVVRRKPTDEHEIRRPSPPLSPQSTGPAGGRTPSNASVDSLQLSQPTKAALPSNGREEGEGSDARDEREEREERQESVKRNDDGQNDDGVENVEERGRPRSRQGITIQEPPKPSQMDGLPKPSEREELEIDARALVDTFASFRTRRPHIFDSRKKDHRDSGVRGGRGDGDGDGDGEGEDKDDYPLRQTLTGRSRRRQTLQNLKTAFTRDKEDNKPAPYLSWEPTLGRNSAFLGLTEEQREELGGIEYRSLKTLALVLLVYFWGFWLLGVVCLLPWIMRSATYGAVVDAASQSRVWWGFFTPHSAFMDLGLTLTPDSMNSFNTAVFPLLLMSFLIVIGNTGFPVMLRFVIWVASLVVPRYSGLYEELKFLLDHPRRCFTLLFPSDATWWLFWLLVIMNGLDLLFFCILDLGNGPIFALPAGIRVLDGLFQAFSTRTAGFSCVNLSVLHPAVQASYLIMMYISVFPIAISVRRTNVYEENSLGVYNKGGMDDPVDGTGLEYVGAHLRRQLSFDLWYLFIGFFILTISEGSRLQANEFSMFAVLFEVVSAYGTVGMSLGFPGGNASLCSRFSVVGKLVIIAMMIRGRHRGLPYGLDRAILLPNESLLEKEAARAAEASGAAAAMTSAARRPSSVSLDTQAPALRASSTNRERRRSRSMDRVNTNILTQFLHPGPSVPHKPHNPPVPRASFSDPFSDGSTARATGVEITDQAQRMQ